MSTPGGSGRGAGRRGSSARTWRARSWSSPAWTTTLHPLDNTYCPGCGSLLVERHGLRLARNAVTGGRCPGCGREIAGVGWNWTPAATC